nr:brefeldin A-inhibited guanine nucleotide-exchange protein 5 [Ipomoea batatas]
MAASDSAITSTTACSTSSGGDSSRLQNRELFTTSVPKKYAVKSNHSLIIHKGSNNSPLAEPGVKLGLKSLLDWEKIQREANRVNEGKQSSGEGSNREPNDIRSREDVPLTLRS